MQLTIDRVPRAMHEVLAEPGRANHGACGVIDRGAGDGLFVLPPLSKQRDRRVPRTTHHVPRTTHFCARLPPSEPHPRLIGENAAERHTGPQVQQHHLTRREATVAAGARLVMRIGRVCLEPHDRRMIGNEPGARECVHHTRLRRRLAHLGTAPQLAAGPLERRHRDFRDRFGRAPMPRELGGRPARREPGHEHTR